MDDIASCILERCTFLELHKLRRLNKSIRRAVTLFLDKVAPSLVVLGGLDIELDDEERRYSNPAVISSSVHALRFSCMKWYTLPSMPTPRFSCAVCTLPDGRIVVAGGISTINGYHSDPVANPSCFVQGGNSMMGQPMDEAGNPNTWRGRNSQRGGDVGLSNVVEVFHPSLGSWSKLPPLPIPRAGAKGCYVYNENGGDLLLILGGNVGCCNHQNNNKDRNFTRDVEVFSFKFNKWLNNVNESFFPHMIHSRSDFALTEIAGLGIFVVGGTNKYLWPNKPLTAEFFRYDKICWEEVPEPPKCRHGPDRVSKPEQIGCESVSLQQQIRCFPCHVIVQGGMRVDPDHYGKIPAGSGQDSDSEVDVWFEAENSSSEEDEPYNDAWGDDDNNYNARLTRSSDFDVFDLENQRWLIDEEHDQFFQFFGPMRAGTILFNPFGNTLIVAGGNYEYSFATNQEYPQHGSTDDIFVIDGPKGKRIQLYWPRHQLRRQVTAAGTAKLTNIKVLVSKHGWQDLRIQSEVELHDMKTQSYNGKKGIITKDIGGGANGRWGVLLEGIKNPISVRAKCLRVLK